MLENIYLNFGLLYYGLEEVLFFDDNDNNNTLLVLKYNVKTTTFLLEKTIKKRYSIYLSQIYLIFQLYLY